MHLLVQPPMSYHLGIDVDANFGLQFLEHLLMQFTIFYLFGHPDIIRFVLFFTFFESVYVCVCVSVF